MRLALYQPDIPQNTGTLIRLGACMDVGLDLIEPFGFAASTKELRRAAMDYADRADICRHASWAQFQTARQGRIVLLTTKGAVDYRDFVFAPDDILLLGRESAGVPVDVHQSTDAQVVIPMAPGARSLNVAMAGAMVLGEALRQFRDHKGTTPHGQG